MKKLARFLSAVLVLAMVVSLVPAASANAAKNYIFISGTKTQVSTEKKLTIWVGGKAVNLDYMINKKSAGISGTWKSSKPSVIKIDKATGEMKALKNGGVVITFTAKNGTKLKAGVYARTRATALNINSNGENVNAKELTLKVGEVLPVSIDMPVNKTALQSGSASSYKVYPEVEDSSVVQVIKSSNTEYKINAAKEGTTKVNLVANYSKEANVRKNKYYKENYVT
ncbi:MAG: Ig-like domain-containing protein, partial [Lachnospiraceae bacterium]|nr:Ig-like domain-containing protein [Lachnospiraceae bacterium]